MQDNNPQDRKEAVATRGVKLKNKNTEKFEKEQLEKETYKQKFSQTADRAVEHSADKGKRAVSVISRFLNLANDKTLARNRGGIAADVEKEIRQELLQLALDLNNDETEPDNGSGAVVAISVLAKIVLLYRDRINELEFKLGNLERDIKKTSS